MNLTNLAIQYKYFKTIYEFKQLLLLDVVDYKHAAMRTFLFLSVCFALCLCKKHSGG